MTDKPISTVYHETTVTYNEQNNNWTFTLRGKDRSAGSLALAKEAIDKPAPRDKKSFKRFQAYYSRYGSPYIPVEVTSLAERSYGRHEAWISYKHKNSYGNEETKREKVSLDSLVANSQHNKELIERIVELNRQEKALEEDRCKLIGKLEKVSINPGDYD